MVLNLPRHLYTGSQGSPHTHTPNSAPLGLIIPPTNMASCHLLPATLSNLTGGCCDHGRTSTFPHLSTTGNPFTTRSMLRTTTIQRHNSLNYIWTARWDQDPHVLIPSPLLMLHPASFHSTTPASVRIRNTFPLCPLRRRTFLTFSDLIPATPSIT
jgi:hypothetical protein